MSGTGDAGWMVTCLEEARSSRYNTQRVVLQFGGFHMVRVPTCAVAPSGQSPTESPKGLAMADAGAMPGTGTRGQGTTSAAEMLQFSLGNECACLTS